MNKGPKTIYTCQTCGYQTAKWMGRCPDCGEWHTFVEEVQANRTAGPSRGLTTPHSEPVPIDAIEIDDEEPADESKVKSKSKKTSGLRAH